MIHRLVKILNIKYLLYFLRLYDSMLRIQHYFRCSLKLDISMLNILFNFFDNINIESYSVFLLFVPFDNSNIIIPFIFEYLINIHF